MDQATVIYNAECPICSAEIDSYRRRAEAQGADLSFVDLNRTDMGDWGISRDEAARRLYVAEGDRLHGGIDAFILIWRRLPGLGWVARLVDSPLIRPLADVLYERVAAPFIYRLHLRRVRARGCDDAADA